MSKKEELEQTYALLEANTISLQDLDEQLAQLQQQRAALRLERNRLKYAIPQLERETKLEEERSRSREVDFDAIASQLSNLVNATPELLPFQQEDCAFVLDRMKKGYNGVLNANAMGLGKTLETLAVLKVVPNVKVLWLTKKSLVRSTSQEAKKWGFPLLPLEGISKQKGETLSLLSSLSIQNHVLGIITNYEILNTNLEDLFKIPWDIVVVDEVHKLKGGANASRKSQIWLQAKKFLHENPNKQPFPFFLTGSPIQNKPGDMWAYLHLFSPTQFPSLRSFERFFDGGIQNLDNTQIMEILTPNMIRRRKDEVGIQMPFKNTIVHEIDLPQNSEFLTLHKQLTEEMLANLPAGELSIANLIAQLHYLRLLNIAPGYFEYNFFPIDPVTMERSQTPVRRAHSFKPAFPKLDYAFELACEILDEGENVIIWTAQYNAPIEYLEKLFQTAGYTTASITGTTKDPQAIEHAFQQNEIRVLICNQKAAAEGFNFHRTANWPGGASQAIHLDKWWNPAINEQAADRIWRVGSIVPVTIHEIKLNDSVDEVIFGICEDKELWASTLMENADLRPANHWRQKLKELFS